MADGRGIEGTDGFRMIVCVRVWDGTEGGWGTGT